MILNYQSLRPVFQLLVQVPQNLAPDMPAADVKSYMRNVLSQWPQDPDVEPLSSPIRSIVAHDEDEIDVGIALKLVHITSRNMLHNILADDYHSIAAINQIQDACVAFAFKSPEILRGLTLHDSQPPLSSDQEAKTPRILATAPLVSIWFSIMDLMTEQMGLFAYDPTESNPVLAVTLLSVNKETVRQSGMSKEWLTGQGGFFQEMHPDHLHKIIEALQTARKSQRARIEKMWLKAVRNGRNIWLEGDIEIFMPKSLLGGQRIGYFRFIDVRETGETAE